MKTIIVILLLCIGIHDTTLAQTPCDTCSSSLTEYTLVQNWTPYNGKDSLVSSACIYEYGSYRKMGIQFKDGTKQILCIHYRGSWKIVKMTNTTIILAYKKKALFYDIKTRTLGCPCMQNQKQPPPSHDTRD